MVRQVPSSPYDFLILTDGSGYTDGYGGFAGIAFDVRNPESKRIYTCGCKTPIDTDRAEFLAVLSVFHAIMETKGWYSKAYDEYLLKTRPKVLLLADRESMVGSINGEFKRRTNPDLWAQFAWYEERFDIRARHIKRETHPIHSIADALSSEMRLVLKEFVETQTENGTIS